MRSGKVSYLPTRVGLAEPCAARARRARGARSLSRLRPSADVAEKASYPGLFPGAARGPPARRWVSACSSGCHGPPAYDIFRRRGGPRCAASRRAVLRSRGLHAGEAASRGAVRLQALRRKATTSSPKLTSLLVARSGDLMICVEDVAFPMRTRATVGARGAGGGGVALAGFVVLGKHKVSRDRKIACRVSVLDT